MLVANGKVIDEHTFNKLKLLFEFEIIAFGIASTKDVKDCLNTFGKDFFIKTWDQVNGTPHKIDIILRERNGYIIVESKFNKEMVSVLKRNIGSPNRRYEPNTKKWFIDISNKDNLINILKPFANNLNYTKESDNPGEIIKDIKFEYLDIEVINNKINFGYQEGYKCYFRNVYLFFIPKQIVFDYFKKNPINEKNSENKLAKLGYYDILKLPKFCQDKNEIKVKYRQAAIKYHTDLVGGNNEAMVRVNQAYEILKDPKQRKKYNMGLKLCAKKSNGDLNSFYSFSPPRNNGSITAKGIYYLGYFIVKHIANWDYLYNRENKKLITTFNSYTKKYETEWV